MANVYFLLPAYNEEASLENLVHEIIAESGVEAGALKIIVCDDGSQDGTAAVLDRLQKEGLPIESISHKLNRGLGETIRDLFEHTAGITEDDDIIFRMDCDETHDPRYAAQMMERLAEGFDVVIASRFQDGGGQKGVNAYRGLLSRLATYFMYFFFPIPGVREYTCGYRCYRAGVIKKALALFGNDFIQLKGLGFTCTLEKLVKLNILGARFGEIPFTLRYDRKIGPSKMVTGITTLGYLVMTIMHHWPWGGWRRGYRHLGRKLDG